MGLVHIYCGDGKGKTSAAVGQAVRAAGRGMRVVVVRFLKTDDSGEVEILNRLPEVTLLPCEKTFGFVSSMDEETKRLAAEYNRELFERACLLAEDAELLVLDELAAAVRYGMLPEARVLEFLSSRPEKLEVVMTGREPAQALLDAADYITECRKLRHPFDRGIRARKGIEY